jgi:ribosomal protein S13
MNLDDPLTEIEGIGPTLARRIEHHSGITMIRQLSEIGMWQPRKGTYPVGTFYEGFPYDHGLAEIKGVGLATVMRIRLLLKEHGLQLLDEDSLRPLT